MSNLLRRLIILRYRPPFVLLHFSVAIFFWSSLFAFVLALFSFDYPVVEQAYLSLIGLAIFNLYLLIAERYGILEFQPNKKANLNHLLDSFHSEVMESLGPLASETLAGWSKKLRQIVDFENLWSIETWT